MADIQNDKEAKAFPIDSKYRKILIAAKRSKQIQKAAQPRVNLAIPKRRGSLWKKSSAD